MDWVDIGILYRHELRCALRERNVMLYVVLVPALLYPLLVWLTMTALSFVVGQSERTVPRVAIYALPANCTDLPAELQKEIPGVEITTATAALTSLPPTLDTAVNFHVDNATLKADLVYDSSRYRSVASRDRLEQFMAGYRDKTLERLGQERGLTLSKMQLFAVIDRSLSTNQDFARYILGVLLPFTLIVILSLGGMYSAIDCTAGERERSTWETSLTLASSRTNLVFSKYLYVATMCTLAGLLNLMAMTFSLRSFLTPIAPGDMTSKMHMSLPLKAVPVIFLGTVALSGLLAALMMLLSSLARTFREGQALVSPLFLLMLLPIFLVMDKTMEFDKSTALIPVVNVALLWRESLQSTVEWDLVAITMLVSVAGVGLCLWLAQILMGQETLLLDGGGGLLKKLIPSALRRGGGSR